MGNRTLDSILSNDGIDGTEVLIECIDEALKSNENIVIMGSCNSGKTSVLKMLTSKIIGEKNIKILSDYTDFDIHSLDETNSIKHVNSIEGSLYNFDDPKDFTVIVD